MQVPTFRNFVEAKKDTKDFLRLLIITDEPEEQNFSHC